MSATRERNQAMGLATKDFDKALAQARKVSEPWFRCQALAWVARYAPEPNVVRIANEGVKAARMGRDEYQQVGAAAWAVRALVERGKGQKAARIVSELVELSAAIRHPVSRFHALFLLWQAAYPLTNPVKDVALHWLVAACRSANSWQAGRTMRDLVLMVAAENKGLAEQLAASMREGRFKRQAQKQLAEGRTESPRSFFWEA